MWDKFKTWFLRSETIFVARATAVAGFATAVMGSLDFSPLFTLFGTSAGFTSKQVMSLGIVALVQGVGVELARRRNTVLTANSELKPI